MFRPPSFPAGSNSMLSPILVGGLVARPLPPLLLQPLLSAAIATLNRRNPALFERLSDLETPVFLIDPVDLPLAFILNADTKKPALTVRRDGKDSGAVAIIRGPVLKLLELLEGRTDGDALFFSRDLVIEGDTEAVVALRNAVDDTEIDLLNDLVGALGPLSGPIRRLVRLGQNAFVHMTEDMAILQGVLVSPSQRRVEAQAVKLRDLEEKVTALRQDAGRHNRRRTTSR